MKKNLFKLFGCVAILLSVLQGCEDKCTDTLSYVGYRPVYMLTEELRNAIKVEAPRTLNNPGKIYLYGDMLLINEPLKGVHIIDNANPSAPVQKGFINIPGNIDMAIKDGVLYVDSYIDLVVLDIANPLKAKEVRRISNAFPMTQYYGGVYWSDTTKGIIVDWEETDIVETVSCHDLNNGGWGFVQEDAVGRPVLMSSGGKPSSGGASGLPSTGTGGSMARFTLAEDNLYTVTDAALHRFDVSDAANPKKGEDFQMSFGIETIFPYNGHLFVGAQNGMHIFSIANPAKPTYVSSYAHVTSCDPVVVSGNYAFVTLRSGNQCQGFTNQLDVVDISNLSKPKLHKSYPMQNPHGLGLGCDKLFICEGQFGFKSFDPADLNNIKLLEHLQGIHAYDVIVLEDRLIMIGETGLYQYECKEGLPLLSVIPVVRGV